MISQQLQHKQLSRSIPAMGLATATYWLGTQIMDNSFNVICDREPSIQGEGYRD